MSRGDVETTTPAFRQFLIETMSSRDRDDQFHFAGARDISRRISAFGHQGYQRYGSLLPMSVPRQAGLRAYIVDYVESIKAKATSYLSLYDFLEYGRHITILSKIPFRFTLVPEFDMPVRILPASIVRPVWTSDDGSMARETALTRWPRLVQGMMDDVTATAKSSIKSQQSEAEEFITHLLSLKGEIIADAALSPLSCNTPPDIERLNDQLEAFGQVSWLNSPWLFAECYLYRRVQSLFAGSKNWKDYDIFKAQKEDSLIKSRPAVEELAAFFTNNVCSANSSIRELPEEEQKLLFLEMTQVALWGNGTDLSLLSSMSANELRSLQGRKVIEDNRRNIVDDDSEVVYSYLASPTRANRRIDIVLDNAGFELFTDLVYAAYLLESGLASCIVLWVKDFPWFVSDATQADVSSLLQHLDDPMLFPDRGCMEPIGRTLSRFFEEGSMTVRSHAFWTTAESFHSMQTYAPGLLKCLRSSALVIFKGDLNYRKLTMDGLWPHDTPFSAALGPLGGGSGVKVLALRTNKADVCVGVEDQDRLERLLSEEPTGVWLRDGKHAVISFSDGCSEYP